MYCTECGAEIKKLDSKFCPKCGKPVVGKIVFTPQEDIKATKEENLNTETHDNISINGLNTGFVSDAKKKNNNRLLLIFFVVVAILVVCYFLFFRKDNKNIVIQQNQTSKQTIEPKEEQKNENNSVVTEVTNSKEKDEKKEENENSFKEYKIKITKIGNNVKIRSTPTTKEDNKVGNVHTDEIYDVYEDVQNEGYIWHQIGIDKWMADDGTWAEKIN